MYGMLKFDVVVVCFRCLLSFYDDDRIARCQRHFLYGCGVSHCEEPPTFIYNVYPGTRLTEESP